MRPLYTAAGLRLEVAATATTPLTLREIAGVRSFSLLSTTTIFKAPMQSHHNRDDFLRRYLRERSDKYGRPYYNLVRARRCLEWDLTALLSAYLPVNAAPR